MTKQPTRKTKVIECVRDGAGGSYLRFRGFTGYWTLNPQLGYVDVPTTSRALRYALREAGHTCVDGGACTHLGLCV